VQHKHKGLRMLSGNLPHFNSSVP